MSILLFLLFAILGALLGTATGLIPGIHVNNIAILAIYFYSTGMDPLLLSSLVVGTMISHTFFDFIPSTYLGAPEAGTALSVLPMHRFLLNGEGYKAVYLSTIGSAMAMFFSLPIMLLYFLLFKFVVYGTYVYFIPVILIAIILYLFYVESKKGAYSVIYAMYLFLLSGAFGFLALRLPQNYNFIPFNIGTSLLFPIFTGLFGIPVLISSIGSAPPAQRIERPKIKKEQICSSMYGTVAGSLVGFLPGVSSGVATVLAKAFFKEENENYVVALGSVNTANSMLNLAALFIIAHPRSEAVNVIGQMLSLPQSVSGFVSPLFFLFLASAFISGIYAFPSTLLSARAFSWAIEKWGHHYGTLSKGIIFSLLILVFLLTGPLGLAIAGVAVLIGVLPPRLGVMRVHLMGVIILPVLLFYI